MGYVSLCLWGAGDKDETGSPPNLGETLVRIRLRFVFVTAEFVVSVNRDRGGSQFTDRSIALPVAFSNDVSSKGNIEPAAGRAATFDDRYLHGVRLDGAGAGQENFEQK